MFSIGILYEVFGRVVNAFLRVMELKLEALREVWYTVFKCFLKMSDQYRVKRSLGNKGYIIRDKGE